MSFISPEFILFFIIVIPLYFLMAHRFRWLLLLIASYIFYAFGTLPYLPLVIFSTLVDYLAARMIHQSDQAAKRKLWLIISLSINLGILIFFKYSNFFIEATFDGLSLFGIHSTIPQLDILLPIGISFYTFQSMSYTIDVYKGKLKPEPNLGIMATYVAFFPQLVAGPIERATHLLPQFHIKHHFNIDQAVEGFQRILWGFFKKVVIADRLALYVNPVYGSLETYTGIQLIIATIFFAFQIYCDFSAYSDIAIGTAQIMGFKLMENFRQPYFSLSIREFWSRWHISLSTWFRDYVYIPLGGNRVSLPRNVINLLIVFLLSGLWHGAGWTFIIWGALHGVAIALQAIFNHFKIQILPQAKWLYWLLTFAFLCITWVFFRANSLDDALYVFKHSFIWGQQTLWEPMQDGLFIAQVEFLLAIILIFLLMFIDWFNSQYPFALFLARIPLIPRWAIYYLFGAAIMFSGLYGSGAQQFIYFRF
ncbi:MBOAT family protein [Anaerolineales bacterium]